MFSVVCGVKLKCNLSLSMRLTVVLHITILVACNIALDHDDHSNE